MIWVLVRRSSVTHAPVSLNSSARTHTLLDGLRLLLPRAGYAAFFKRKIPEKRIPGRDLLQRPADHGHPKTRRDKTRAR
jgi:hypothetical protein